MIIWKKVLDFEHYEVSNTGLVRSTDFVVIRKNGRKYTHKGRIMTQTEEKDGYKVVVLIQGKRPYKRKVHKLVYEAFNGRKDKNLVIDHIDNNRYNNNVENLQVITNRENLSKDTWRHRKNKNLPLGVSRRQGGKRYVSLISINGKSYYLGSFLTIKEASDAYQLASKNYKEKGEIPNSPHKIRNKAIDGFKICSCCGRNLPLSEYYVSKGRIQGKCKECFKKERKRIYYK